MTTKGRWRPIELVQRSGGGYSDVLYEVEAIRRDRTGSVRQSGELVLAERQSEFIIRDSVHRAPDGTDFALNTSLILNPAAWCVLDSGGVYFVESVGKVPEPAEEFLSVLGNFVYQTDLGSPEFEAISYNGQLVTFFNPATGEQEIMAFRRPQE